MAEGTPRTSGATYKNIFYKRQMVAGTQDITITDSNGLQRTYVFPNNRWVEPDEELLLTFAEIDTIAPERWENTGPQ